MLKITFIKYLPPVRAKLVPKFAQNLLKFGTSNISSIPNSILMSKISFTKYLPPARLKLVLKLKLLRSY